MIDGSGFKWMLACCEMPCKESSDLMLAYGCRPSILGREARHSRNCVCRAGGADGQQSDDR